MILFTATNIFQSNAFLSRAPVKMEFVRLSMIYGGMPAQSAVRRDTVIPAHRVGLHIFLTFPGWSRWSRRGRRAC
jgi:hypothetical protein